MEKFDSIEDVAAKFAQGNQDYSGCSDEMKHAIQTAVVFGYNEPWRELKVLSFGEAIKALESGYTVRRKGWNGKGLMVFKQVPAHIGSDIIPTMQSLPTDAKNQVLANTGFIDYTSQCLIYNSETGCADSWVPSISDVFSKDWEILSSEE